MQCFGTRRCLENDWYRLWCFLQWPPIALLSRCKSSSMAVLECTRWCICRAKRRIDSFNSYFARPQCWSGNTREWQLPSTKGMRCLSCKNHFVALQLQVTLFQIRTPPGGVKTWKIFHDLDKVICRILRLIIKPKTSEQTKVCSKVLYLVPGCEVVEILSDALN